jgi:DNA-binding GntR family transcriptional regulator
MWVLLRTLAALIITVSVIVMTVSLIQNDIIGFTLTAGSTGVGYLAYRLLGKERLTLQPTTYRDLAMRLRWEIQNEGFQPGDRLPTLAEIAARFNTTKTTAHRAIKHLVEDGIVESRRGYGIFVSGGSPARSAEIERYVRRKAALRESIPPAEALALSFTMSATTVRRILRKLINEGVVRKRPGGGYERRPDLGSHDRP